MSVLSRISRDELQNRLPDRIGKWTGRTSTTKAAGSEVRRRAADGWNAAKGAGRSITGRAERLTGRAERRWPKRAGIAAATAGVVGGATAFLRDPERRAALMRRKSPETAEQPPSGATVAEPVRRAGEEAPTGSNGTARAGVGS